MAGKGVISVSSLIGGTVMNSEGEQLGRIEDVRLDVDGGFIAYVVLCRNSADRDTGQKCFLLPWGSLVWEAERGVFLLDADRRELIDAPGVPQELWPDRPILEEFGRYRRGQPLRQVFWK